MTQVPGLGPCEHQPRIVTHWGVACTCAGTVEVLQYDDEEDAARHLPLHDGYLVSRQVIVGPWRRAEMSSKEDSHA